jgi:diaminohydroxyphosphoribosylaminopyrimidine deaminase/5-amino-6-(5-phosphoribosylamino)uracil reductase
MQVAVLGSPVATPELVAAMRRAIELATAGLGSTGGNPCVGAVVLDVSGQVVGEGRTEPHGALPGRHAELVALAAAGDRAVGGTVVSTLEPCNGTGRTGPCSIAIAGAGVARVVYGVADPVPAYAGGALALVEHGIQVIPNVLGAEATEVHEPWLAAVRRGSPWVTLKLAASLDGRAAAADGSSRWITSPEARLDAHQLRGRMGAIVVGSGTVLADDPQLTVRGGSETRHPLRVVLDRRGRIPVTAQVFDNASPSLRFAGDLRELSRVLFEEYDVRHLLVEGGPTVAGAYVAEGLVDEVVAYIAPAILGAGTPAVIASAFESIDDALRLQLRDVARVGADLRLTARLASRNETEGGR